MIHVIYSLISSSENGNFSKTYSHKNIFHATKNAHWRNGNE